MTSEIYLRADDILLGEFEPSAELTQLSSPALERCGLLGVAVPPKRDVL